ncbi:MAG TPA: copper-binding protein [Candidatus Saccharimonadales bacterium]|nr:copper-binding protein [Candidatus Saccharimonadales bacterium]
MNSVTIDVQSAFAGAQHACAPRPQDRGISRSLVFFCLVFSIISALSACQSAPAKHYPLQAEVISVDAPRKLIVIKHGDIPGLMPAMTMSYAVLDSREIEQLHPGDKITAELVVADEKGHLEKIVLVSKAPASSVQK